MAKESMKAKERKRAKLTAQYEERRAILRKAQNEYDTKLAILDLLDDKKVKMPASDIDAHLKYKNVDQVKEFCEKLYHNGQAGRTGNYRYFTLKKTQEKSDPIKGTKPKSDKVDVKAELKKFKEMLDEGLIEQQDYDKKKKDLLKV